MRILWPESRAQFKSMCPLVVTLEELQPLMTWVPADLAHPLAVWPPPFPPPPLVPVRPELGVRAPSQNSSFKRDLLTKDFSGYIIT